MKMKKILKKFTAVILSLVMMLSMSLSVLAINTDDKGTVNVNGISSKYGGNVYAYKVISFKYDYVSNAPENPAYYWNDSVATWLANQSEFKSYIGEENTVTNEFLNLQEQTASQSAEKLNEFVDALASEIKKNGSTISIQECGLESVLPDDKTSVTFNELDMGAYLFLVKDGVKIYSAGFAGVYPVYNESESSWKLSNETIEVNLKSNEPTITKTANKQTVAIGDTVTYTLNVDVPQYPDKAFVKTFSISDKLASGLTLDDSSVKIMCGNTDIKKYFDESNESNEQDVTFKYDAQYSNLKNVIGATDKITVTYSATVSSTAYSLNSLKNIATLTYNFDPYNTKGQSKDKESPFQLYTYGMQITKEVDTENDSVVGTQFTLTKKGNSGPLKFTKDETNNYYYINNNSGDTTLEVDENGVILIRGLDLGIYELKETKAPAGYAIPKDGTTIEINENNTIDGEIDVSEVVGVNLKEGSKIIDNDNKNQLNFTIMNYKNEFNLPTTGGMGTMIFTVAGILLMGGAVALMVIVSKKRKTDKA